MPPWAPVEIISTRYPNADHLQGVCKPGFQYGGGKARCVLTDIFVVSCPIEPGGVIRRTVGGVFDRLPGLRVILGHLGEGIPFHLPRIDDKLPPAATGLPKPVSGYFREHFAEPLQIRSLANVSTRTTVVLSTAYENRPPGL